MGSIGRKRISIIASGLSSVNLPLQPWRYLSEIAKQLAALDYSITVFTNGKNASQGSQIIKGVDLVQLPSINNPVCFRNKLLEISLKKSKPDIVIIHTGLSSFLHQDFHIIDVSPILGVFTSPIYSFHDLKRIGLVKLLRNYTLSAVHILGTFNPRWLLQARMQRCGLRCLVVQTETLKRQLIEQRLWEREIHVIPPGVDELWSANAGSKATMEFPRFGFSQNDIVIGYFGSLNPLRGFPDLLEAMGSVIHQIPSLKLLVFNRDHGTEQNHYLEAMISRFGMKNKTKVVAGLLSQAELVNGIQSCDLIALPFEMIPSDAPLSILETKAAGKILITTRVGCIPELVENHLCYLIEPSNTKQLSEAIIEATNKVLVSQRSYFNGALDHVYKRNWLQIGLAWDRLLGQL